MLEKCVNNDKDCINGNSNGIVTIGSEPNSANSDINANNISPSPTQNHLQIAGELQLWSEQKTIDSRKVRQTVHNLDS